jgi:hypothetical protein
MISLSLTELMTWRELAVARWNAMHAAPKD